VPSGRPGEEPGPRSAAEAAAPRRVGAPTFPTVPGAEPPTTNTSKVSLPSAPAVSGAPGAWDGKDSSRENQHPNLLGGASEPHKPDKLCGDKSGNSRRNLKISRSGRFKEKRKVRATLLPEGVRSPEEAGFPGDPHDDTQ
uniref:Proline rich 15 n=1 Tax=Ursus maritimus TaxID=29073 RepID=A0A452T2Q7_URSMA